MLLKKIMTLQTLGKLASIALGCLSAVVTILAYLAPRLYYHHTVALIAVVPAIPGQAASVPIDGPSVYIGIFGMKFHVIFVYTNINQS